MQISTLLSLEKKVSGSILCNGKVQKAS